MIGLNSSPKGWTAPPVGRHAWAVPSSGLGGAASMSPFANLRSAQIMHLQDPRPRRRARWPRRGSTRPRHGQPRSFCKTTTTSTSRDYPIRASGGTVTVGGGAMVWLNRCIISGALAPMFKARKIGI